jgi:hypothetical protein
MSADKLIWASEAESRDILAPSAEKIAQGWRAEIPPHEYFNWHMNRTDRRLAALETPVTSEIASYSADSRTETIKAGQRFDLPCPYIVGGRHLRVFLEGILCEPGERNQYMECGVEGAESTYIRWNDDIPPEYGIRIEVPIRSSEPVRYADEELVGRVADLADRVAALEAPVFCKKFDFPADTRAAAVPAGRIFTLPAEYVVGADQLQVYRNGILLYEGKDYHEVGAIGDRATDITFTADLPVSDNIRAYVSIRAGEQTTVLNEAVSLEALARAIADAVFRENRQDAVISERIEAMAEYVVPEYTVGDNSLRVYKNGRLLVPDHDYSENGISGEKSVKIIWNGSVEAGAVITVTAPKEGC